jgi:Bacterial Ig-like domain (group 3)
MRWQAGRVLAGTASIALAAAVAIVGLGAGGQAVTVVARTAAPGATSPSGHLGTARQLPLAALHATGDGQVSKIACASPGTCTAAGSYDDAAGEQVFVVSERNGAWGQAEALPGLKALNVGGFAFVTSLACAAPGTCAAGGEYQDRDGGNHAFIADSVNGTWGNARNLDFGGVSLITGFGFDFRVNSVSCAAPGECAAGLIVPVSVPGTANGRSEEAFVAAESAGRWGAAQPVPGIQALNAGDFATVNSVSCRTPGNCVAGGAYEDSRNIGHPFLATESGGTWGAGAQVPGVTGLPGANASGSGGVEVVTCLPAGSCTAAGFYSDASFHLQSFVAEEGGGSWNTHGLPGAPDLAAHGITFPNVACGSEGNCTFAMGSQDASNVGHLLVSTEMDGVWGATQRIPGLTDVQSAGGWAVSCDTGGCAVGGRLTDAAGRRQAFIASETAGTWGAAQTVAADLNGGGDAEADVITCPRPGTCVIGGEYEDRQFTQRAFIAERSPATAAGLTLSSRRATAGHEQAERLTVRVTPRTGGTPGGKVIIKAGSAAVCTITLAKAKGACRLKSSQLRRGTYHLTASYRGSRVYAASTSAKKTLTVTR